jgi:cytochrome P450
MPLDSRSSAELPALVPPLRGRISAYGFYTKLQRNLLELFPEAIYREPMISGGRLRRWTMIAEPSLIERVMKHREAIYPRSDVTRRIIASTRGENIFVAYGEAWRRMHKAIVPVFQHRGIANVAHVMTESAEECSRAIAASAPGVVDIYPVMVRVTCDIICDVAMSGREQLDRPGLIRAIGRYLTSVSKVSVLDLLGAPNWVPRPIKLFDRSAPTMDRMMDKIILARLARGPGNPPDVLDMLIAKTAADADGRLSMLEVRNNLLIFMAAGHETSALALTWALYLLAHDRGAQLRARALARDVLGARTATIEDVPRLGYVRQVLEEGMRLYPPGAITTRTAQDDDELGSHRVRRGDTIILPIYALHRHRRLWDEPDAFRPERMEAGYSKKRHRYAYLPFGAGPRICLGMAFAMTEMTIILATLLARFDLSLPEGFEPEPQLLLTLRPATGMPLHVRRLDG